MHLIKIIQDILLILFHQKKYPLTESAVEFESLDVLKTLPSGYSAIGVGSTANLYLYGKTNQEAPPENVIEGYRFGARTNDSLKILVSSAGTVTEYSSRIVMPGSQDSSEKVFTVNQSVTGINSIGNRSDGGNSNTITFDRAHTFINGESVRVISDNGHLPDGLDPNTVYYAITDTILMLQELVQILIFRLLRHLMMLLMENH